MDFTLEEAYEFYKLPDQEISPDSPGMTVEEVKVCIESLREDFPPEQGFVYILSNGLIVDEREDTSGEAGYVTVFMDEECVYYFDPPATSIGIDVGPISINSDTGNDYLDIGVVVGLVLLLTFIYVKFIK